MMVKFQIKRGHDGPARRGIIKLGDVSWSTPALVGSSKYLQLISTGSLLHYDQSTLSIIDPESIVLLPSLLGISGLDSVAAKTVVESQLEAARNSDSNHTFVVRIPSSLSLEDFKDLIPTILDAGIHTVAFLFNDELGENDSSNLLLRALLPRNWVAIALGRIRPSVLPLLIYTGFDLIDMGYAHEAASRLIRVWPLRNEQIVSQGVNRFCPCVHCQELDFHGNRLENEIMLFNHNVGVYETILSESIQSANEQQLRWVVEATTHSSPEVTSFLRRINRDIPSYLEEFTPTVGSNSLPLIGPESYNSPAVKRFREYVSSRYSPPQHKEIILLLPCSARKPYSDSKTHRRFSDILDRALGSKRDSIAEAIITSPLGIVPRELERIYPAANYDIPVTGEWDFEETKIAADALVIHLEKFKESDVVVAHVSGGYLAVVKMAEERIKQSIIYTTYEASPTSRVSLTNLSDTLLDLIEIKKPSGKRTSLEDTVRATADFQFDIGAGELLVPPNAKVGGKVYGTIISREKGEQLCAYLGATGTLSLTLEGAKRINTLGKYWVKFEGSSLDGSTLFAVGVESADYGIRPGDEVIIKNSNDEVVGAGRSEMSGREMCDFDNGIAVKVRHKAR
ncbi:MAG: DUF5591 domain-containing protein [Candidatus Thorarchaeota archaeon]|nr:DUF5591 domain-containing protein [Candidatus Thorarchaeota archaeon]